MAANRTRQLTGRRPGLAVVTAVLLVLVGLSRPASAQDAPRPLDPWGPPLEAPASSQPAAWELPLATVAITGANWLDVHSTQQLVAAGGREEWNPGLYGPRAERIVPVKMAVIAGETGIFCALRKWRKEAAWTWVAVVVVGNALLARRNDQITGRLQLQQGLEPGVAAVPLSGFQVSFSW